MQNNIDRARQFLPFDALKGFREALLAKEKEVINKKELSEDEYSELEYKINCIYVNDLIKITYFNGTNYTNLKGIITKIDKGNKYLT